MENRRRRIRLANGAVLALLSVFLFTQCLTSDYLYPVVPSGRKHPEFTVRSQLEIIWGLAPEEIEKRFGPPDRTSLETRGTKTEDPWRALVYTYVMGTGRYGKYQYVDNLNVFEFGVTTRCLEYWYIEMAYPDTSEERDTSHIEREIIFYDGIYLGHTKQGRPDGIGKYIFNSGFIYEGEWRAGKKNGQGTNYYPSGDKYIGEFVDGIPSGGIYIFSDGEEIKAYMDENHEWQILD